MAALALFLTILAGDTGKEESICAWKPCHPGVHLAMRSWIDPPCHMADRVIFDYELVYCESGRASYTVEGETFVCGPGDIILFRPNQRHSLTVIDAAGVFSQPHVHFDLQFAPDSHRVYVNFKNRDALSPAEWGLMRRDLLPELGLDIPSLVRLEQPAAFHSRLLDLIGVWERRRPADALLLSARLLEMLYMLAESCRPGPAAPGRDKALYDSVRQYIEQSGGPLTLERLSALFGVSKYHLAHRFRELYGEAPVAYWNRLREERACRLLTATDEPVSAVADRLGFSSVYAFSRFFRARTGQSPTACRREARP